MDRAAGSVGMVVALAFALAARAPYFAGTDFPLNDGGMFVAMARDLLAAHFALPAVTSYNFEDIPFAYPPLSFYLVAAISGATGVDAIALVRFLPLVANLATVAAVSLLARSLVGARAALLGTVIFALIPRSYEWMIMGGGLTRSFGFVFAVACLLGARRLFDRPTPGRASVCAALAALALATHLELGLFVFYSLGLMAVCYGRGLRALALATLVVVSAVGLTSPWWLTVVSRDGLAPFAAASHTGGWTTVEGQLLSLEAFVTPPRLLLSLPAALALLGVLACLMRRQPFLPLWLPLIFLLNPRSAATYATVPLGLLAAVGLCEVVGPGLVVALERARAGGPPRVAGLPSRLLQLWRAPGTAYVVASAGMVLALVGVYLSWPSMHPNRRALDSLSAADRQALQWVTDQTAPTSQFLVLTRGWTWEDDNVGEWFPVLAERRSVLTPQGTEWLPDGMNLRQRCLYDQARQFGSLEWGVDRLDEWARDRNVVYTDIYITSSVEGRLDWRPLIESARLSPNYTVRYDTAGVVVLERTEPIQPRWDASGPLLIAQDCTSLSEQPAATQQAWDDAYGPLAGRAWVDDHNAAVGGRTTLLATLTAFALGGLGH